MDYNDSGTTPSFGERQVPSSTWGGGGGNQDYYSSSSDEEEKEKKTFTNSDLMFWDWFWKYLNQATNQNQQDLNRESNWAIGGSFAIFWWECFFGIEPIRVTWNDIDISLNYGNFVHIPKSGDWTDRQGGVVNQDDLKINIELTQKIANRLVDVCGGEIISPKWLRDPEGYPKTFRKKLTDVIQLRVNLKNKDSSFRLDLSFKDNNYFKPSNDGYGGGIYYFVLESPSFNEILRVPIFSIKTLLNIYYQYNRTEDQPKIDRLNRLNRRIEPRALYPCNDVSFHRKCFGCDQRMRDMREMRERDERERKEREERDAEFLRNSWGSQEFSYGAFGENATMQDNDVSSFYDVPGSSSDIYMSD